VIDSMFVTNGILFVALLRLMWIPYGLVSYMLGVTSISLLDYMIGTSAIIVMISLYVLLGCTIYQAEEDSENEQTRKQTIIILVVEIAFTIVVTIIIGIWATRIFNSRYEEIEKEEQSKMLSLEEESKSLMKENSKED